MKTKFSKSVSLFMSAIMTVSAPSLSGFITNAETNQNTDQTTSINDLEVNYDNLLWTMLSDESVGSNDSDQETESQGNEIKADEVVEKVVSDPDANSDDSDNEETPQRNNFIEDGEDDIYPLDGLTGVCGVATKESGYAIIEDEDGNPIPTVTFTISMDVCYIRGNGIINCRNQIPKEVKKIVIVDPEVKFEDSGNFSGAAIESIDLSAMNITKLPTGTFRDCVNLSEVILPPTLEIIEYDAFENCKSLKNISLPDSVKYLNQEAFNGAGLTSFNAPPNLKEIGYRAFWLCGNLKEVNLNDGLEYIASNAFESTPLSYINIPSTVNKIGNSTVFAYSLLGTVVINSDFDPVRTDAFYHDGNKYEKVDSGHYNHNNSDSVFLNSGHLKKVIFSEGVTTINDGLFLNNKQLEEVSFPSTLKKIGYDAFAETHLSSLTLPEGLEYIDDIAFINSINIVDVNIPESVTYIGDEAFFKNYNHTDPYTKEIIELKPFNSITINNPDCEIGERIVPYGENVIVYGHDGSTAQKFAKDNKNTFISLDTETTTTTSVTTTDTTNETTVTTSETNTVTTNENTVTTTSVSTDKGDAEETESKVVGDANGDGTVDMADAVLIMQALANPNKYGLDGTDSRHITESGLKYADADGDGLTVNDAQRIQLYLLGKISSLN